MWNPNYKWDENS
uniref:Uncharacterized protein n=1 Tax=Rhizophora mucronata TaxID=61149 RepID=A0A2P2PTZ8_RHIMU